MKKLLLVSAFLLVVGNMPAPDGPVDLYRGYKNFKKQLAGRNVDPYNKTTVMPKKSLSRKKSQNHVKTSPYASNTDRVFAQQLCKLMNNPKRFKSMGMEKCHDCHCVNGMLVCKCMHREDGPVVRFNEQDRFLNFNHPQNHPVVVVPQNGYELALGNLKEYLMKKLYNQYQQEHNTQPQDYIKIR